MKNGSNYQEATLGAEFVLPALGGVVAAEAVIGDQDDAPSVVAGPAEHPLLCRRDKGRGQHSPILHGMLPADFASQQLLFRKSAAYPHRFDVVILKELDVAVGLIADALGSVMK